MGIKIIVLIENLACCDLYIKIVSLCIFVNHCKYKY